MSVPNTFCIIDPTFTILNEEKAEEGSKKLIEMTRSETSVMYYGFVRNGNTLTCREGYVDGEGVNAHLDNVGAYLGSLMEEGTIKLESIKIHGPKEQLEIIKPKADPLGAEFFEVVDGGWTNIKSATGSEDKPNNHVTLYPTFTVPDWSKVDLMSFCEKTKSEEGCVYYGWTKCGDKLVCREAYRDGNAINAHVENVGEMLGAALNDGVVVMDSITVQGPKEELEIAKKTTEALGAVYLETTGGFTRFT